MTRLIYHPAEASANTISPIDATIIEMVISKSIKIACPYLGREPLQRIVDQSTQWQLLTDVEELLRSQGRADRDWFVEFLVDNAKCVRHCKRLHAKVILAELQALVGSANFTGRGLKERAEMSVLLSDPETVEELNAWFDKLWNLCSQVNRKAIVDFTKTLPVRSSAENESGSISLPPGPQINSKLMLLKKSRDKSVSELQSAVVGGRKPKRQTDKVMVTIDGKQVEWDRKKACVLLALQSVGPRHELTKSRIFEIIKPSIGIDAVKINKQCKALKREGLATVERRGTTDYRTVTEKGMRVQLPPESELLTL